MSQRTDRVRARRDRTEANTRLRAERRQRQRQAEALVVEVLNALSRRDAVVDQLEQRAGRALTKLVALRWLTAQQTATACGLTLREAARLRQTARPEQH